MVVIMAEWDVHSKKLVLAGAAVLAIHVYRNVYTG